MPKTTKEVKDRQLIVLKCIEEEIFTATEITKRTGAKNHQTIANDKAYLCNNGLIMKAENSNEFYLTDKGDLILEYGFEFFDLVPCERKKLDVLEVVADGHQLTQNEQYHCKWLRDNGFISRESRKAKHRLTEKGESALEDESILKYMEVKQCLS